MDAPVHGTVNWFQIGTDDSEAAQGFYGGLFGWKFTLDPEANGYDLIKFAGDDAPSGGIAHTNGGDQNHATFLVIVRDVAAACAEAEKLGGSVLMPATTAPSGLVFAHLADPSGNGFGVYTPPAPPA